MGYLQQTGGVKVSPALVVAANFHGQLGRRLIVELHREAYAAFVVLDYRIVLFNLRRLTFWRLRQSVNRHQYS